MGKGAERHAHVSVNANCKSAVGTLCLAHRTLAKSNHLPVFVHRRSQPLHKTTYRAKYIVGFLVVVTVERYA